jgi:hypothetical protein
MPAFYKIDKKNRLVMTTGSGTLTMADSLGHQEKLRDDPEFDPSYAQLLDFSHVSKVELNSEDIRRIAKESIFSPTSRRAILVTNDTAYGLARMFEILRETAGDTGIEVFRSLDEALDWVLARGASA